MSEQVEQSNAAPTAPPILLVPDEDMLLGSMRDFILDGIKPSIGWPKLKEARQHAVNNAVEQACRQAIRDAAPIIAGRHFDTISTTVGDINTKGELVIAKLSAERTRENILGLAEAGRCTLVLVDPEVFMGAKPAAVMKDQPSLLDPDETPEAKAKREAIDQEAAEHEASVARAKEIGQAELPEAISGVQTETRNEFAEAVGTMLRPEIKAAAERGRAHAEAGGAPNVPDDLKDKLDERGAWLKGYDSVAHAGAAEGAKAPRGHRGKRTSTDERLAKRAAETAEA